VHVCAACARHICISGSTHRYEYANSGDLSNP
jgi:hypothetical protein